MHTLLGKHDAAKISLTDYLFKLFIESILERCGTSYCAANGPTRSIAQRPWYGKLVVEWNSRLLTCKLRVTWKTYWWRAGLSTPTTGQSSASCSKSWNGCQRSACSEALHIPSISPDLPSRFSNQDSILCSSYVNFRYFNKSFRPLLLTNFKISYVNVVPYDWLFNKSRCCILHFK